MHKQMYRKHKERKTERNQPDEQTFAFACPYVRERKRERLREIEKDRERNRGGRSEYDGPAPPAPG